MSLTDGVVALAAAALLFAGTSAAQTPAWRTVSHRGLTLEIPSDWTQRPGEPWTFRAQHLGAHATFGLFLPIRSSSYLDFDEWTARWLQLTRDAHGPVAFRKRRVSGFDALTVWPLDPGRADRDRDTWIGVPENGLARGGSVYTFSLSGRVDSQTLPIYERMLSSMRLDPRPLR